MESALEKNFSYLVMRRKSYLIRQCKMIIVTENVIQKLQIFFKRRRYSNLLYHKPNEEIKIFISNL